MSVFEHNHRARIFNPAQHPYKHTLDDFTYTSDALPGVTTLQGALDWLFTALYPRTQDPVANQAALPGAGNTIGDHRVVTDDGDGKAAGYQWQQREGDVAAKWYKISDMDWGVPDILSQFLLKTQDVYAYRYGYDDVSDVGVALTGNLAGQHFYGGATANSHLTLYANSGDGVGAGTGFVQFGDHVRPLIDSAVNLGTTANRFLKGWFDELQVGTLICGPGSITDSSGAISFGDENLSTTGTLAAGQITGTAFLATGASTLTLDAGSITDSSGAISFADENLTTTGTVTVGSLLLNDASITDSSGAISFDNENLSTTGTLQAGVITGTQLNVDNLRVDGNTLSSTSGALNLLATTVVDVQSAMTTLAQTVTGVLGVTGQVNVDNLRLDGNTLFSTNADGNIIVDPAGTGLVEFGSGVFPTTNLSWDNGKTGNVWNKLWLGGAIADGTTEIASSVLQSLRDINAGVATGHSIFWNGTKWVASVPDSEVDHGTISGLGDDDHSQYALLLGRSGGQTLRGGTASGNNLTLNSTSHATKGDIICASDVIAGTDNTFDLGESGFRFKDLYLGGQAIGLRAHNATTAGAPSASAGTKGRLYFNTDENDLFVDLGGTWKKISIEKYVNQDAVTWNGSTATATYTVSSDVSDARLCVWSFSSNSLTFEQLTGIKITKTQTEVTVTSPVNLPVGTYTLIGIG